jgi:hypothetical protein
MELRDEHRPQQRMAHHEAGAFRGLLDRMPTRRGLALWLIDAGEGNHGDGGERGGEAESGRRTDPSDQRAAERGASRKRDGAREFDPRIRGGQLLWRDERRHQGGCCDTVDDRAADGGEAEQGQQGQAERAEPDQEQDRGQRHSAQGFGTGHQEAARHAVGGEACGDRDQDEGQGQRGLQQAGLAFADAEHEHGDDGRCGQRDLLSRLGGEVGPGQPVEGGRQLDRRRIGHGTNPGFLAWVIFRRDDGQTHPLPDDAISEPLDAVANELQ